MKKRIFILILIAIVLLTSCTNTNKNLVVQNNADNEQKETIGTTTEPDSQPKEANDTVKKPLNVNDHIDKIIEVLFKEATLYSEDVLTIEDIEKSMRHIWESATDLDSDLAQSNGIDNLEDLKELAEEQLAEYQKQMQTAYETKIVIDKQEISSMDSLDAMADMGNDDIAYLSYDDDEYSTRVEFLNFGEPFGRQRRYLESNCSNEIDLSDYSNAEFDKAKYNAFKMIEDIQIKGMELSRVYVSQDQTHMICDFPDGTSSNGVNSEKEFYVFCFGEEQETKYGMPIVYERLQIWTEGSEIVQFVWVTYKSN